MSDNTDQQDELVTIATFPEPMEANMARSALEASGIPVFVVGETANSMIPVAFESQLQVQAKDEAAARRVVGDAELGAPQQDVAAARSFDARQETAVGVQIG